MERGAYGNEMTVQQQTYLIVWSVVSLKIHIFLFPECFAERRFVLAWQQFFSRQFFKACAL